MKAKAVTLLGLDFQIQSQPAELAIRREQNFLNT